MIPIRELLIAKLMHENSRANMQKVQDWAQEDRERIAVLFSLMHHSDPRIKKRSAWVISHLEGPYIHGNWDALLAAAENPKATDGIKRSAMRIMQTYLPEEDMLGRAWNLAFRLAQSRDESIAVRAFAFGTLEKIGRIFPELKTEMKELAAQERPYTQKGLLNRIDKVLQRN